MNWGWKIVLIYGLFAIMTLSTAIYFMGQKVDLVADDYYKQEIEYQGQIDKIANAKALEKPVGISYSAKGNTIKLSFPEGHLEGIKGKIHFYSPSNADEDITFDLQPTASGDQMIAVESLRRGFWKIKISWKVGDTEYFHEKIVDL